MTLARLLCRRFQRPRIHLMAHSGGTFIGIQAAARAPELFESYVGGAQIADQLESEVEAHRFMVEEFYSFERSAHSPQWEEPGRVRRILRNDVLRGRTDLADRVSTESDPPRR